MKNRLILMLIASALLLLVISGCGIQSDPQSDIDAFFAALSAEDYDTADSYVYNFASLGFSSEKKSDNLVQSMCDAVNDSRDYCVLGCEISGRQATAVIELRTLDLRKLSAALEEAVAEEVSARRLEGEPCDESEDIIAISGLILPQLLSDEESYMTSDTFPVTLVYDDDRWNINITDELYCALIGYAM